MCLVMNPQFSLIQKKNKIVFALPYHSVLHSAVMDIMQTIAGNNLTFSTSSHKEHKLGNEFDTIRCTKKNVVTNLALLCQVYSSEEDSLLVTVYYNSNYSGIL